VEVEQHSMAPTALLVHGSKKFACGLISASTGLSLFTTFEVKHFQLAASVGPGALEVEKPFCWVRESLLRKWKGVLDGISTSCGLPQTQVGDL
jgi:hypothetical protein